MDKDAKLFYDNSEMLFPLINKLELLQKNENLLKSFYQSLDKKPNEKYKDVYLKPIVKSYPSFFSEKILPVMFDS